MISTITKDCKLRGIITLDEASSYIDNIKRTSDKSSDEALNMFLSDAVMSMLDHFNIDTSVMVENPRAVISKEAIVIEVQLNKNSININYNDSIKDKQSGTVTIKFKHLDDAIDYSNAIISGPLDCTSLYAYRDEYYMTVNVFPECISQYALKGAEFGVISNIDTNMLKEHGNLIVKDVAVHHLSNI